MAGPFFSFSLQKKNIQCDQLQAAAAAAVVAPAFAGLDVIGVIVYDTSAAVFAAHPTTASLWFPFCLVVAFVPLFLLHHGGIFSIVFDQP